MIDYRALLCGALLGVACGTPIQDPIDPPPGLLALVVVPASVTLMPGQSQQFIAISQQDSTFAIQALFSAEGGGTISADGLFTAGQEGGTFRIIASTLIASRTVADTALATVALPPPPPPATVSDPDALPAVNGQLKNVAAYTALNVRGMAAGGSYNDPVTGVRVWKVTSASVPYANPMMAHYYSEGPAQISREWAAGRHTLAIGANLVDFQRGVGFSNWRSAPSGTRQITFSKNPATPRIAFVTTNGGQLRRFDTGTMQWADVGLFPVAFNSSEWLQQDKDDRWFVALGATAGTVLAWNSATGQSYTRSFSNLDEPYLERDGRYVLVNVGPTSGPVWDLQTNTLTTLTAPGNSGISHTPSLRSYYVFGDNGTGNGITPHWRIDPSPAREMVMFNDLGGYTADAHNSGMWVQTDAELGGDLRRQWFLRTSYDWSYVSYGAGAKEALAFLRIDGGGHRLLLHHYSVLPTNGADNYWSEPRAILSIDGKLAMFDSNMNNGPRVDVFLAEVPVR